MNTLVQIITEDDGSLTGNTDWHFVDPGNPQGPVALCTQEFFGAGESGEYETKTAKRGGITCRRCVEIIRKYKAIKL